MLKFRNVGPYDVAAFRPEGEAASRFVAVGDTVEVPGSLSDKGDPDAYLVEHDGDTRSWPKAQWELVEGKPKTAVKEN